MCWSRHRRPRTRPHCHRGPETPETAASLDATGHPILRLAAARAQDAAATAAVLIASRRAFMPFAPSRHGDEEPRAWVAGHLLPAGGVTLAWRGPEVAGVLALQVRAGSGWIDQLYVAPPWVGQGIGSALLAHALAQLPGRVHLYTFQANARARRFYEAGGFVAVAFGDGRDNEEGLPDLLYEHRRA